MEKGNNEDEKGVVVYQEEGNKKAIFMIQKWRREKEMVEGMVDQETDKNEQRNGGRGETRSGFEKSLIEIGKEVKGLCDEETEVVDLEDWKSLKEEVEEMVHQETEKK